MVYGLVSLPLHKQLSWTQVWIALAIFCVFMLICSIFKDRFVAKWKNYRGAQASRLRVQAEASSERSQLLPEP